jgi:predicted phosphodiesterase
VEAVASSVYRYVPTSAASDAATFAVLNDTHEKEPTLAALTAMLAKDPPDVTVYNGDVFDDVRDDDQVVRCVLRPAGAAYASERAVLFVPGNHDHRGVAARGLHRAFTPWPGQPGVPRCFAVRVGPVALVGLDTGEDKPDHHPAWAGLAAFEPYRAAQRDWLAAALDRREIASAPYLVVCCHIPLVGRPGDNPGDTLEGYAAYCRHAQQLWHPLLAAARAHVVISGHTHRHRYDAPDGDRPYAQLVGGGPQLDRATIIRGRADAGRLELTATACDDGRELGRWTFAPRPT